MRLSTRGRYGVAALCELAARYDADTPVPLRDIAASQAISESYLEQIFLVLRRAGLVGSVRGAQGGYILGRPPGEITIGEIIRVLEGPIAPVACVIEDDEGDISCSRDVMEHCATRQVWVRLATCMSRVLDSVTLGDIALEGGGPVGCSCAECALPAVDAALGDAKKDSR